VGVRSVDWWVQAIIWGAVGLDAALYLAFACILWRKKRQARAK